MSFRSDWRRVSKRRPCPVCTKPDWCAVSSDGAVALCQRVESPKRVGNAGWLHRLEGAPGSSARRRVRTVRVNDSGATAGGLGRLAGSYTAAVDPERLRQLAVELGVSVESLRRLGIGWSAQHGAWSFPMTDAAGNVRGFRLRRPNGFKFSVTGGHEGLFIPSSKPATTHLTVVEGPTDTAALLDMGLGDVVGRPSCTGGTNLLVELVRLRQPCEVDILADGDEPGVRGANALASVLVGYVPGVRVVQPPDGIKDPRAWLQSGGSRQDVERIVQMAPIQRLQIQARQVAIHG